MKIRPARSARDPLGREELEGERERGAGDDDVERQQQVRLRRADETGDPRRRAGEHGDRRAPTASGRRASASDDGRERADDGGGRVDAVVAGRRERDREQPAADRPGRRGRPTRQRPLRRDEEHREAERADDAAEARQLGVHPTTTVAFAVWPAAVT